MAGDHHCRQIQPGADAVKLTYDPERNIAYLSFADRPADVETVCVSDVLNVDLAEDGTVYGIEMLDANRQLLQGDALRFVITNAASGTTTEVALSA
jgi:uncharacterized protein YuzE